MSEPGRKGDLLILAHVVVLVVVVLVVVHLASGCDRKEQGAPAVAAIGEPAVRAPASSHTADELADARTMCALREVPGGADRDAAIDSWLKTRKRSAGFALLVLPSYKHEPGALTAMRAMAAAALGSNDCDPWIDELFGLKENR